MQANLEFDSLINRLFVHTIRKPSQLVKIIHRENTMVDKSFWTPHDFLGYCIKNSAFVQSPTDNVLLAALLHPGQNCSLQKVNTPCHTSSMSARISFSCVFLYNNKGKLPTCLSGAGLAFYKHRRFFRKYIRTIFKIV